MSHAANVVPFLSRPLAEGLIHRLGREDRFVLEPDCIAKMRVRRFDAREVMTTLTQGSINQGPRRDECGDYRCRIRKRVAGRLVRVIVDIHAMNFLYIISVY
jgi:hypothetical protein